MNKEVAVKKRVLEGIVVSNKMEKTIIVKVESRLLHPVYKKIVVKRKKFKAHDPQNSANVGDKVKIVECRPYSKDKRFRLLGAVK